MEYKYQLVLHYGIHYPADAAGAVLDIVRRENAEAANGCITGNDSNIIISMDSDRHPRYGVIFVEKLTTSTGLRDDSAGLAIDMRESDLENTRLTCPQATAYIGTLYDKIRQHIAEVSLGWRVHVCEWRIAADDAVLTPSPSTRRIATVLPERRHSAARVQIVRRK